MKTTYVLMRFYGGGGIGTFKIVKCKEDNLWQECEKFEKECVRENIGEFIGILTLAEFKSIQKELK